MLRDINLNEISDGRLYTANDMVKADCMGCQGCSSCCQGMGDSIVLDPYDMYRLCTGLKTAPAALLSSSLELGVVDGLILPHLKMNGNTDSCMYLNKDGRCSIHPFRPGFCRLFPLGRYYENDSFSYFLQTHIFSRLTNVQNLARQRSKSVNGLMSWIFQGTKNSYPIGTTISNRYKTML